MKLPTQFIERMQRQLGDDYALYEKSLSDHVTKGIRLNKQKISSAQAKQKIPFLGEQIPWCSHGFYDTQVEKASKHPYYAAGLYYMQEPSAMLPAQVLPVKPGDIVLDLCAAPGGKTTELGVKLQGKGLLVANDISASRAKALLKNIELFGLSNVVVTNETPKRLTERFAGCFDCILLDAPCSGEGMFRKEPAMCAAWERNGPSYYEAIQKELILYAAELLKPGGFLVYSTCTFSPQEDEGILQFLLQHRQDFQMQPIPMQDGFLAGCSEHLREESQEMHLEYAIRLMPHRIRGEGHFVSLLQKTGGHTTVSKTKKVQKRNSLTEKADQKQVQAFLQDCTVPFDPERICIRGAVKKVSYLPAINLDFHKLRVLREGLYLGEIKKNRFEPSQAFACALSMQQYKRSISFLKEEERLLRYLKGETILFSSTDPLHPNGWYLVGVEQYALGWGKMVNGQLKNKYHPGWRWTF